MNQAVDSKLPVLKVPSFDAWLEKAIPAYTDAFHAFMSVVQGNKNQKGEVEVECQIFYDALQVTRELINSEQLLKELEDVMLAPALYVVIEPYLADLRIKLEQIQERCVEVEGALCIDSEDLFRFIRILVQVISEVGSKLSVFIIDAIEPFNNFISAFDAEATIDLVNGEYHLLVAQEAEELEESRNKLAKENQKLSNLVNLVTGRTEPDIYVVCDKEDLLEYIEKRWSKQILMTQHATDSLIDSQFKDIKKVVKALDLLGHDFFQVFSYGLRMDKAKAAAQAANIEFKPSMSDVSMGKHSIYDRKYKEGKADFNRHLCIGNSRTPERCFRLHFEWDEEEQKIVIHHAGNHLPVASD
ncbi:hypothetical protein ACMXYW_05915 [Neptuniibacter sp. QD48_55]|uniref:hypothetical protein n=1 Tax=Neptuniibacter sp. QD48_55 TaxID=3398212 RepID=UPI0039F58CD6